jgi:hypothetical protein
MKFDTVMRRAIQITGIGGVIWETCKEHVDRPYLFFLYACMMGLSHWDDIASLMNLGNGSVSPIPMKKTRSEQPRSSDDEA